MMLELRTCRRLELARRCRNSSPRLDTHLILRQSQVGAYGDGEECTLFTIGNINEADRRRSGGSAEARGSGSANELTMEY
jgi:hypothetical protein